MDYSSLSNPRVEVLAVHNKNKTRVESKKGILTVLIGEGSGGGILIFVGIMKKRGRNILGSSSPDWEKEDVAGEKLKGKVSRRPCSPPAPDSLICLSARASSGGKVWYVLNLDCLEEKKMERVDRIEESCTKLTPIWQTNNVPVNSCLVAVGSTLYSMGGDPIKRDCFTTYVRCADVSCPAEGWNKAVDMINPRSYATAVSLGHKIFVFSGCRWKTKPWAEVFDSDKGEWKDLAEPPVYFPPSDLFALAGKKKIALCSLTRTGLYVYKIRDGSWETVDKTFCLRPYRTNPVLVGNTLYWLGNQFIHAYDMHEKRSFSGPIECPVLEDILGDEEVFLACFAYLYFIHLGRDSFCVIWLNRPRPADLHPCYPTPRFPLCGTYSRFVCATLRVSKHVDWDANTVSVSAIEVSVKAYPVDVPLASFYPFLLDRSVARETGEGIASTGVVDKALV